ncbi:MAG: aquaporin [Alphaproteobacteria bacterium]|nr:MAG: aquaporin [Alphaproteobacteria bacterium]
MTKDDWRKYVCELIGTFTLVFFAAGAVMVGDLTGDLGAIGAGLISGLVITVVIYAFGHVSGAHVNPALSIAAACLGKLEKRLLPGYVCAQMVGSAAGGLALLWIVGRHGTMGANLPNVALGVTPAAAFAIELFLSFLLMWVICGTAFDERACGSLAGLAIGATVGIEVMLMGPYAGAAMNPARAFGPYLAMGDFTHFWIYAVGPVVGMLGGAVAYGFTHGAAAWETPATGTTGTTGATGKPASSTGRTLKKFRCRGMDRPE